MITLNGISGISSILGALTGTQEPNDTETATSLDKKYKTAAQDLVSKYGFNNKLNPEDLKSSSFLNGFSDANKNKLTKHLVKLSPSEIVALFRNADKNRNGDVTATEGHQYLQTLNGYIADGKSKEEIQALDNAQFLKNGGTVSDATKEKWVAQFEKYNIAKSDYTPTETTDSNPLAKLLGAVPGLIGSFQNNSGGGFSSVSSLPSMSSLPSLASMANLSAGIPQVSPPPSFAEMARLAGLTGATNLNGQPINPFLPSPALGTNVFGGASAINSSTLNPLLAGSAGLPTAFNPLTAGSAQQPFAQTNFVPSVVAPAVAPSGFSFTPATPPVATVGTAQALPTGVAATTPAVNPAVTSWAPATPTLLAQARPPQALPQAPVPNGGW
jgi:hypothetical protein